MPLGLPLAATLLAYLPQFFLGDRHDHRMAMRHGLAMALIFTGVDHFVSAGTRYVPMIPDALAPMALELVLLSGAAELLGAIGLLVPLGVYRRLCLPNLQRVAGASLAAMFALLVIANINVAVKGIGVEGLPFGRTYFMVRPLLQPLFMAWALYCVGFPLWPGRRSSLVTQ
jgi:uncharacterized membrane protein